MLSVVCSWSTRNVASMTNVESTVSLHYCSVDSTVCRLFYVGSREGHMPGILSSIQVTRHTPAPAVIFTVCQCILTNKFFFDILAMVT